MKRFSNPILVFQLCTRRLRQCFPARIILKRVLFLTCMIVLVSLPMAAQEYSRAEIYGGPLIPFYRADSNMFGFKTEVAVNLSRTVGLVGQFSYGTATHGEEGDSDRIKEYSFLVGPRFSYRADRFRFYGHILAGRAHGSYDRVSTRREPPTSTGETSSIALSLGIGFDYRLNSWISIRPAQLDWLGADGYYKGHFDTEHQLLYSGGIVFHFFPVRK